MNSTSREKNTPNDTLPRRLQILNNETFVEAVATAAAHKTISLLRDSLSCATSGRADSHSDLVRTLADQIMRVRDDQTQELGRLVGRQILNSMPVTSVAPPEGVSPPSPPWRMSFRWLWEIALLAMFIAAGIKIMRF